MFRNAEIRKHPVGKKMDLHEDEQVRTFSCAARFKWSGNYSNNDHGKPQIHLTLHNLAKKTSPAAIMRPERAPRRAKMDPKTSQGVPKWPPGDKQWNLNDFLKLSGLFLEPFWVQIQGKNQWNFVAVIYAQKTHRLYAKNDINHVIKIKFFGWWIQRFKPKYIMWKSLNSCRKTVFLKDQHVFEIWKKH